MRQARQRPLSPATSRLYRLTLHRAFPGLVSEPPDVEAWPESSRRLLRAALKRHWLDAKRPEMVETIFEWVPQQYEVRAERRRVLSEEEILAFERAVPKMPRRWQPMLRILLRLGLRSDELLKLPRGAVMDAVETGEVVVTRKGGWEHRLSAKHLRRAFAALLAMPAAVARVRLDPEGEPFGDDAPSSASSTVVEEEYVEDAADASEAQRRPWAVVGQIAAASPRSRYQLLRRAVKRCAALAGLSLDDWAPHSLRHAFATRMARDGAPLHFIQAALGHRDIATTQRYVHITAQDAAAFFRR